MYNVIIIGAGVIGASIARELAKYNLKICVLEKEIDVAMGTTKANSAIVHAGFDAHPNTNKGKLNAKGSKMFDLLAKELDFPFKRIGSLVICFNEEDLEKLHYLKEQGEKNNVTDLKILNSHEVRNMEPNLSDEVVGALYAPTGGIVCPYEMTVALAENAHENGVKFFFQSSVINIEKLDNNYRVVTDKEVFTGEIVINAAGLFADEINNMVSKNKFSISPRRGEYLLFDKLAANTINKTIFQLPTKLGKGVLVTPTIDGNILIGPNSVDVKDKYELGTSVEGVNEIVEKAKLSIKHIPMNLVITSFAGLRAIAEGDDFIIGEQQDAKGFINAAGIQSPGLSSAPAIAELVRELVIDKLKPKTNMKFKANRQGILKFREMTNEERNKIINENPAYGNIICRCELVTEGEVIDAIRRPIGAKTLDGVKIRTRAGMGRCQSGFCSTRILDLISKELGEPKTDITKFGRSSKILAHFDIPEKSKSFNLGVSESNQ